GAYREKIRAYAAWSELRSPEERRENACQLVEDGWKGVKLRIFHDTIAEDIAEVENVRNAVGDKLEIMVDANQGVVRDRNFCDSNVPFWSYGRALDTAKELKQLGVVWLEEPLDHYDYHGLQKLCANTDIAIAGGEIYHGIGEHQVLIENDCYDIIQPNLTMVGGFSQVRKIATLAEHHGNKLCNIHGWSPGVGVAASVHCMCAIPNADWLEFPYDPPAILPENFQGIVKESLTINPEDGCLYPSERPGFGVELDEEKIRKYVVLESAAE
ncbi:MAG: mandelate racemase/muconate lactonizing enzyme family protein, partial [Bacteroides thetaiotaomicron]|nr:mandelate racemase/muconate lactonizing enzyme family protein [Bacteroides thetaiotaomicron]